MMTKDVFDAYYLRLSSTNNSEGESKRASKRASVWLCTLCFVQLVPRILFVYVVSATVLAIVIPPFFSFTLSYFEN